MIGITTWYWHPTFAWAQEQPSLSFPLLGRPGERGLMLTAEPFAYLSYCSSYAIQNSPSCLPSGPLTTLFEVPYMSSASRQVAVDG
jgi:hypothetical protein